MFQFTCPSRSTTLVQTLFLSIGDVSIHVPLAEHDGSELIKKYSGGVSIHVPLAEHDDEEPDAIAALVVSIHVPLAEHDGNNFHPWG